MVFANYNDNNSNYSSYGFSALLALTGPTRQVQSYHNTHFYPQTRHEEQHPFSVEKNYNYHIPMHVEKPNYYPCAPTAHRGLIPPSCFYGPRPYVHTSNNSFNTQSQGVGAYHRPATHYTSPWGNVQSHSHKPSFPSSSYSFYHNTATRPEPTFNPTPRFDPFRDEEDELYYPGRLGESQYSSIRYSEYLPSRVIPDNYWQQRRPVSPATESFLQLREEYKRVENHFQRQMLVQRERRVKREVREVEVKAEEEEVILEQVELSTRQVVELNGREAVLQELREMEERETRGFREHMRALYLAALKEEEEGEEKEKENPFNTDKPIVDDRSRDPTPGLTPSSTTTSSISTCSSTDSSSFCYSNGGNDAVDSFARQSESKWPPTAPSPSSLPHPASGGNDAVDSFAEQAKWPPTAPSPSSLPHPNDFPSSSVYERSTNYNAPRANRDDPGRRVACQNSTVTIPLRVPRPRPIEAAIGLQAIICWFDNGD
ncbi:hypothetical protein K435DRAFT_963843 [Dendrothele bispora CBS 962.96]|uniref:Uncharacterized protein n=1 Tax=Dendrothele bispora (strain CBS 962.96) TaxID=1314807 RepID=A0A4V4HGZ3_DENBC|nr:hypothetical protein K435DRAFT_963843 [Dendrothele bispora CBS 962.96]